MEKKKDSLVYLFGGLSVLSTVLVVLLGCLVIHNQTQVELIRTKLVALESSCSCLQEPSSTGQAAKELPLHTTTTADTQGGKRLRRQSQSRETVALLTGALAGIVNDQLLAKLDCTANDQSQTECTLKPGPKGEQGDIGPEGVQGPPGEQGDRGEKGLKGKKGRLGYPGYKGQKGAAGVKGSQGSTGPGGLQGVKGDQGQVQLGQVNCTWVYTDTCNHRCGARKVYTAVCPIGQYVAGFGLTTWWDLGRYDTRVYCCPPN